MAKKQTKETAVDQQEIVEPEVLSTEPATPTTREEAAIAPLNHFDQKLAEYKPYLSYKIDGLKDKAGYKKADDARKEVKRERLKAEKVAENLKAPLTKLLGQIREREKALVKSFDEIEDHLDEQVKSYDKELEAERQRIVAEAEARFNRRLDQLITLGAKSNGHTSWAVGDAAVTTNEIRSMSDEHFIEVTGRMETEGEKIREQERLAEEAAAAEKKRQEEESARLKAEADKLRAEKEAAEKELADMRIALAKSQEDAAKAETDRLKREAEVEAEKLQAQRQRIIEARYEDMQKLSEQMTVKGGYWSYRGELLCSDEDMMLIPEEAWTQHLSTIGSNLYEIDKKIAANERASEEKRLADIKAAEEAAVKAEQDRVAAEKAKAEREEALKPDKQKLADAAQRIADFPTKLAFTSSEAKAIHSELTSRLKDVSLWLTESIEKL
jgi:hypothetical protein